MRRGNEKRVVPTLDVTVYCSLRPHQFDRKERDMPQP